MDNYKYVDGKKMDARLIEKADRLTEGASDGRISVEDAEKLFQVIVDDNDYTLVEEQTIEYILKKYHWTEAAKAQLKQRIDIWNKNGGGSVKPQRMPLEEIDKQQFPHNDILSAEDKKSRIHDLRSAMNETYLDHDDITMIIRLADGRRVEVVSNFIEMGGDFVELKGGHAVPIWAIEKVKV